MDTIEIREAFQKIELIKQEAQLLLEEVCGVPDHLYLEEAKLDYESGVVLVYSDRNAFIEETFEFTVPYVAFEEGALVWWELIAASINEKTRQRQPKNYLELLFRQQGIRSSYEKDA